MSAQQQIGKFLIPLLKRLGLLTSSGTNAAALGPSSSTDNAVARYDGTTGKLIQNSAVTIDDTTGTTNLPSAAQVKWSTDAGLKRSAAGDVRATDGSTGVGTFSASAFNATDGTAAQASLINSSGGRVKVGSGGSMQWSSTTAAGGSADTDLRRPLAGVIGVGNGTSEIGRVPLVLHKSVTSASTGADTNETTLWSYSLPAGTLASDGQAIRVRAFGTTAANGNTKTVAVKFGATTVAIASTTSSGAKFDYDILIMRTGATTQIHSGHRTFGTSTGVNGSSASETLANAITIALTGTNGTANAGDITFLGAVVEFLP